MLRWVDPTDEVVGVHLSICRISPQSFDALSNNDLFVNVITAAVT